MRRSSLKSDCDVYWGSHGCDLGSGHHGWHDCDCCDCGDAHPWPEPDVLCVARFPYYGSHTRFYGDDAEDAQTAFDAALDSSFFIEHG